MKTKRRKRKNGVDNWSDEYNIILIIISRL